MEGVSIIVCCYNSADRLPQTIKHLAGQEGADQINWEVIVVNNNSTDNTASVALSEWKRYDLAVPFRIVDETSSGLSFARAKGITVALYDFLIFCDDDNWLSANYVNEINRLFTKHSDIDVIGSDSFADYEKKPPDWFLQHTGYFAIGSLGGAEDITNKRGTVWGAGMAVRRKKMNVLEQREFKQILSDRVGKKLCTGGDTELCFALRSSGSKIFYTNSCFIKHYIPENRFNLENFFELMFQNGFSSVYLSYLYQKRIPSKKELFRETFSLLLQFLKKYSLTRFYKPRNDLYLERNWQMNYGKIHGSIFFIIRYRHIKSNLQKLFN